MGDFVGFDYKITRPFPNAIPTTCEDLGEHPFCEGGPDGDGQSVDSNGSGARFLTIGEDAAGPIDPVDEMHFEAVQGVLIYLPEKNRRSSPTEGHEAGSPAMATGILFDEGDGLGMEADGQEDIEIPPDPLWEAFRSVCEGPWQACLVESIAENGGDFSAWVHDEGRETLAVRAQICCFSLWLA